MKPIIVHIPKTGGTTLLLNILDVNAPPKPNKFYRHVIHESDKVTSNCGELIKNWEKYNDYKVISFMRNPLDRIESEYYFLRNRELYNNLWDNFPDMFINYVKDKKNHNSITKFLLGKNMFDSNEVSQSEFDLLITSLSNLNLLFCITEEYNNSLSLIENKLHINLNNNVILYRQNLYKEKRTDSWSEIERVFNLYNKYDILLYKFWLQNHKKQIQKLKIINKFSFHDNKYHSLILYTNLPYNRCPLSIFNPTSIFVKKYTKELIIINNLSRNICGKQFAVNWIKYFSKYFKIQCNIDLDNPLNSIEYIASLNDFK